MATSRRLLLQFGDGAVPEVYSHACTVNTSREFTIEAATVDTPISDCENEDAPAWIERFVDTLSAGISGAGTMDPLSWGILRGRMLSAEPFNVRVKLDIPLAAGGGYFQGLYVMTSLGMAKEGKGTVSSTVALSSAGVVTWVDAEA